MLLAKITARNRLSSTGTVRSAVLADGRVSICSAETARKTASNSGNSGRIATDVVVPSVPGDPVAIKEFPVRRAPGEASKNHSGVNTYRNCSMHTPPAFPARSRHGGLDGVDDGSRTGRHRCPSAGRGRWRSGSRSCTGPSWPRTASSWPCGGQLVTECRRQKSPCGEVRARWTAEHEARRRRLADRELVYARGADGIYLNAGKAAFHAFTEQHRRSSRTTTTWWKAHLPRYPARHDCGEAAQARKAGDGAHLAAVDCSREAVLEAQRSRVAAGTWDEEGWRPGAGT